MVKNYYAMLGVGQKASFEDIRKAYKSMALKFHPDKNSDPGSEAKFKEGNEMAVRELSMVRERFDKASSELVKTKADKEKSQKEVEKLKYDLERTTNLQTKAQNNLEKSQEEIARLQVDMEKVNDNHKNQ